MELFLPRYAFTVQNGNWIRTNRSEYLVGMKLGEIFAVDAGAPGTGREVWQVLRIDEQGAWGLCLHSNIR